jgi:hypothetical protein
MVWFAVCGSDFRADPHGRRQYAGMQILWRRGRKVTAISKYRDKLCVSLGTTGLGVCITTYYLDHFRVNSVKDICYSIVS